MLININNYQIIVIVNLSVIKNFILTFLANEREFFIWIKKDAYDLKVINRNLLLIKNKKMNQITKLLLVETPQYYEKIIFNILLMAKYNIILRMP